MIDYSKEVRVLAANGSDVLRLNEVDLHESVRAADGPIEPLPGLEIMADGGDDYTVIQLDMRGVVNLRRALQRLERRVNREGVEQ